MKCSVCDNPAERTAKGYQKLTCSDQCARIARSRKQAERWGRTDGMKVCSKCKSVYPETTEFFAPSKQRHRNGLYPWCRECTRERRRKWAKDYPDRERASRQGYKANKNAVRRGAKEQNQMGALILRLRKEQKGRCLYCLTKILVRGFHVDHIYPMKKGGLHVESNLCLACKKCNLSKGASTVEEWLRRSRRCAGDQERTRQGLAPLLEKPQSRECRGDCEVTSHERSLSTDRGEPWHAHR